MPSSRFEVTRGATAYLQLPTYGEESSRKHRTPLTDLMGPYAGHFVAFDFDTEGVLIGIEVLADVLDDRFVFDVTGACSAHLR